MACQQPARRDDQQQREAHPRELKALHQDGGTEKKGRKQEPVEEIPLHHPVQNQPEDKRRQKHEEDGREVDSPLAENREKEARHPWKERRRCRVEPAITGFEKTSHSRHVCGFKAEGLSRARYFERPVQGEVLHLHVLNAFLVGSQSRRRQTVKQAR